jgi:sigma-E factor negative regulatory protein RseB
VSRRLVVAVAVAGAGTLALCGLAAIGSTVGTDDLSGPSWVGRVDAVSVSDKAAMTPDDGSAVALLARSAAAAGAVAYAGRAVSWQRGTTTRTEIVHLPGRGTLVREAGSPASAATLTAEGRSGSFADAGRVLALLRVNYRVLREADLDTTVAGRAAEAVLAVDGSGAVAARYWLDHRTGLLLRRELVDAKGTVWSRTAFTTLTLGAPAGVVVPTATPADVWGAALDSTGLASARASGCPCPDTLPGGLSLLETRTAKAGSVATSPVVHQLFSDGLVTASLFAMPGSLGSADATGLTARGFQQASLGGQIAWVRGGTGVQQAYTTVWASHGEVLTLVTDDAADPSAAAALVVDAMPPTAVSPPGSFWDRVVRGWQHVVGGRS